MRPFLLIFFVVSFMNSFGQDDYVAWTSFQLQKQLGDRDQINFKPIIRHNNNLSQYQNISLDFSFRRKLGKDWSGMALSRSWFIPGSIYRHFFFFDLAHGFKSNSIAFSNRLRYHWALEIDGRGDPDYFRWGSRITIRNDKKLKFYFQVEPWLRADGLYQFQRIRYEPGFNWTINKTLKLDFNYRIEKFFNISPERQFNVFVTNLLIII